MINRNDDKLFTVVQERKDRDSSINQEPLGNKDSETTNVFLNPFIDLLTFQIIVIYRFSQG